MSDCTHDCSSCSQSCDQREQQSLVKPLHQGARVGKVIGVVSGKGGVGKSLVTSLLAVAMQKKRLPLCCFGCRYHGTIYSASVWYPR